jgi:hypothetical protein
MRNDLSAGVFEPEAIAAMGEAFDATCRELPVSGQFEGVRELIATLIIGAAIRGELDPARLRLIALTGARPIRRSMRGRRVQDRRP